MAGKTNLTATLFAQKKLLGKTSTGVHRADNQEPIPSGLQVGASSIFSQDIPSSPSRTLWTVQSASAGKAATVEYVEFVLSPITGSTYDANDYDSGVPAQASGPHAYRLEMTGNYQTLSNNTKAGKGVFDNNKILHWTLGGIQLVSPGFSNDVPSPFNVTIYSGTRDVDDEIPLLDELDWQVDYYSGVLFIQDYNAAKIPTRAKGFIYVGDMLSASLGSSGGGTGTDVGWYGPGNGTISTTGSLLVGTNTSTPSNAEASFSSLGAAVFNEQGRDADFRVETQNRTHAIFADASTNQILILSGGQPASPDESSYTDIAFFVSGTKSSKGSSTKGVALFGGDVHVSGNLTVEGSSPGGGGSGTGIGWLGPSNGIISTTGSVYVGVSGGATNPDITFSSTGASVFNEQAQNSDFRVESQNNDHMLFVDAGNDRLGIGSTGASPATTVHIKDTAPTLRIQRSANANDSSIEFAGSAGAVGSVIHLSSSNDLVFKTHNGSSTEEILRLGSYYNSSNRQVILLSGSAMAAGAMQPKQIADINFFVSGSIGSKGTTAKGTSVFGGDLVVSGNAHMPNGLSGSLTRLVDGTSYLRAGSNITLTSASNGSVTISSTASGGGGGSSVGWIGRSSGQIDTTGSLGISGSLDISAQIRHIGDSNTHITFKTGQVLVMSGGAATSVDESLGADVNFYVSGTLGSITTSKRGSSLFGGDVGVSGSIRAMSGIVVGSHILPSSDSVYNLGAANYRFANIYTGDLHLKNKRGDWTIVEESDFLCVINNVTGHKYKMVLEDL